MKVAEAQNLKNHIGRTLSLTMLMAKNTFTLEGILKEVVLHKEGWDAHLILEVTYYCNPTYPADEGYKVGHTQPAFLRKIRSFQIVKGREKE